MNIIKFPFELGTHYEDWELDLEILPDRVPYYDSYLYVGVEVHIFLNNHTNKTELVYNCDSLVAAVLTFKIRNSSYREMLGKLSESDSKPLTRVSNDVLLNYFFINSFYVTIRIGDGKQYLIYTSNYSLLTSLLSSLI